MIDVIDNINRYSFFMFLHISFLYVSEFFLGPEACCRPVALPRPCTTLCGLISPAKHRQDFARSALQLACTLGRRLSKQVRGGRNMEEDGRKKIVF